MPVPQRSRLLVPALAALAACGGATAERARDGAPNVLLISIDTLRADHLGCYGYEKPTSPALDAFARTAVVFEEAQASASWTLPSLASALTSEYSSTHGCWNFGSTLDESFLTLPEILVAAGYDTGCAASHIFVTTRHGLQQGIVHTDDSYAYPEIEPDKAVTSQVIADKGIRFLDQKAASPEREPWFLWLHFFDPHEDYLQHAGITEQFATPGQPPAPIELYDGEIRYTDLHFGRVLEALDRTGFTANTMVVVVSDHGEEFMDHGGLRHGHTLYRELVRVPLLIRAPGIAPSRVHELVRTVDLLPTVLDIVGLPSPAGIAGRSLVPRMRGEPEEVLPALAEIALSEPLTMDSVITERVKLVQHASGDVRELYDLEKDLLERQDLHAERPDEAERLSSLLAELKARAAERSRTAPELVFTPGQLDDLRKLGYGGGSAVER